MLIAALALRVGEVERTPYRPINDARSYLKLAAQVTHGGDYSSRRAPGAGAGGTRGPSAYFPPAFPYLLAAVDLLDGHPTARGPSIQPARISQAVLGTVTVALVGLVAAEAFGSTVGLLSLALAALYPVLIELSAALVAENLMTALVLASIYAMLRARRTTSPYGWIAAAGLLAGLAALSHVNAVVLLPPLIVGALTVRRTVSAPALVASAWVVAILPWALRNASELHRFVPITDETGITLVGTYNPASAADRRVPYKWRLFYGIPAERKLIPQPGRLTEPQLSGRLESQAFDYIGAHPLSPLKVLYHNSRRLLELEGALAWRASAAAIDLPEGTARIGVMAFWALCLLALAGMFAPAARRAPPWVWAIPVLLWLSIALVNAETPRFREPIDPFLIPLAACALQAIAVRLAPVARAGGLRPTAS